MIVHYVFSTYKRRFILTDPDVVSNISTWFREIAKDKGLIIIEHAILADHVHMLIEQRSQTRPEIVMQFLKGISSRNFFKKYNALPRWQFRRLWQKSYKCRIIPAKHLNIDNIRKYIRGQNVRGIDKRF